VLRLARSFLEIAILSVLIIATRCANYQDVFVRGDIYFNDADCYARMTRVRLCAQHPGLIVRHHDFENFPRGTTPHTTAPLDYLILGLSILMRPMANNAIDLAGALISPLLALFGGLFLWWWSRRMGFRYRWVLLILYAISPILVHGTELGRPDHQSLSILLITIGICAEWSLRRQPSKKWSVTSGIAWGLAIWVSAYEPLLLFLLLLLANALQDRQFFSAQHRRIGWVVFAAIIALALLIERRLPDMSIFQSGQLFRNWSGTIGELAHVWPSNPIWLRWSGYLIFFAPILIWLGLRKKSAPPFFLLALLLATYLLTIWQARWAYFFMSIFAIVLPRLLESIKSRAAVWIAFALAIFPILRDWDGRLWPDEAEQARRMEQRNEAIELRALAADLRSSQRHPFLAPWWLSSAIAYWSEQPGVAGSSHESLAGIIDSAVFFQTSDWQKARAILANRNVDYVIAYDSDRVTTNSAAILGQAGSALSPGRILDRTPTQAAALFVLKEQIGAFKLFRVNCE
jgi:hypothetical protein